MQVTPLTRALGFVCILFSGTTVSAAYPVSTVIKQLLADNPELEAAQTAVHTAEVRLQAAGLPLNNPELGFDAERTDVNVYSISISQTLDWHDKQSVLQQAAKADLAVARTNLKKLHLEKTAELLEAIGNVTINRDIRRLSERQTDILKRFVQQAERRFQSGDIARPELELARLSLAEAVMQQAANGAEYIQAQTDFKTLTGQSPEATLQIPDNLPEQLPALQAVDELARQHPSLQLAHQQTLRLRQQIRVVDRQRKTDPTIALTAGQDNQVDLIGVSLSIPLQTRNNFAYDVKAAQSEALQAEQNAQQLFRHLSSQIQGAHARYQLIAKAWHTWTSQGQKSLQQRSQLLEALWKAGEINTTDYLVQIKQTLDTRITGIELHGRLWSAWISWLASSNNINQWLNTLSGESHS